MRVLVVLLFAVLAQSLGATTYYFDYATGNDANSGLSTATPKKRHPYMVGYSGSYAHSAGDRFVFKGGVTWPVTCFQMKPTAGGTLGNPDYYGVDVTWFSGGTFTRPLWDMQHTQINGGGNTDAAAVYFLNVSNVTVDDIEIANLQCRGGSAAFGPMSILMSGSTDFITVTNCVVRDWEIVPPILVNQDNNMGGIGLLSGSAGNNTRVTHCLIHQDNDTNKCGVAIQSIALVDNNEVRNTINCNLGGQTITNNSFHDTPLPSDPASHCNAIEVFGGMHTIAGNVIYNLSPPTAPMLIYSDFTGAYGATNNVYNNVLWLTGGQVPITLDTGNHDTINCGLRAYNNTIDGGSGACVRLEKRTLGQYGMFDVRNNHFITTGSPILIDSGAGANTLITTPNYLETPTQATLDGYTIANLYQPTSGSSPTVGIGVTFTNWFMTDRLGVTRPAGAWDDGAYQFSGSPPPPPPATFTLSITSSPSGAAVSVSPSDTNGLSNGTAPFSRIYTSNTVVSLSVPASGFAKWQIDGVDYDFSAATSLTMGSDHTMAAFYSATNGGTFAFITSAFLTQSTAGHITITVIGQLSTNILRTVNYATVDGSAVAGTDYTATSGTLTFASNFNGAETFNVPILNTGAIGGPSRTFTVNLSEPTGGASLVVPAIGTVSIQPQMNGSITITGKQQAIGTIKFTK